MNRADLRKLIEACRNESDLQLPELEPLAEQLAEDPSLRGCWDRVQRWDHSLCQALHDLPVPEGLEVRLLRSLEAPDRIDRSLTPALMSPASDASVGSVSGDVAGSRPGAARPASSEVVIVPAPLSHSASGRRRWRRGLWPLAIGSVAALLLVAFAFWREPEPSLANEEQVSQQAERWVSLLRETGWQTDRWPTGNFPYPAQLVLRPVRWQSIAGLPRAARVVCYELPSRGGRALLFVAPTRQKPTLRATPPPSPYPAFANWSLGIWKTGPAVYALAVQGGRSHYQQLIVGQPQLAADDRGRNGRPRILCPG